MRQAGKAFSRESSRRRTIFVKNRESKVRINELELLANQRFMTPIKISPSTKC